MSDPLDSGRNLRLDRVIEALATMPVFEQDGGFIEDNESEIRAGYQPRANRLAKANDTGKLLVGDGSEWTDARHNAGLSLPGLPGAQVVSSAADLPDAENGVRTLEADTAYLFTDFVADPAILRMGDRCALLSWFGSIGGYIHTGGAAAFMSDGEEFMVRDFYGHAPGGTVFDLKAPADTDMYVIDSTFSDAPGLGNIADLGTVDGYRVPAFKSVNFEDFDSGITFDGSPDKVFFSGCPFRGVTAAGVVVIETTPAFNADIFKVSGDCWVKDVQADTEVLRVDPGSSVSGYTKYFNVDHDSTVTKSNILNGSVGADQKGVIVRDSFPLANSAVRGALDITSGQTTQVGTGAGATVDDGTFELSTAERVLNPSPGVIQYDAEYDADVRVVAEMSVTGANTTFEVSLERNGGVLDRSTRTDSTSGSSKPTTVRFSAIIEDATSDTPDDFSVFLENTGGSTDLDVINFGLEVVEI